MADIDTRIDHLSEIVANLAKAGPSSSDTRQIDNLAERLEELQAELKMLGGRKQGVGLDAVQSEIRKATNALPAAIMPPIRAKFDAVDVRIADMQDTTRRQTEAQLHDMREMAQKSLNAHELKARAAVAVLRDAIAGELK